jgi:transketolase
VGITPGVETTTGPLGQGITNAVGMALAEKLLAKPSSTARPPVVDHHTYVFLGDGCLMEGISHEACALAGAWKLNKLIALYDDNGISIDGQVAPWFIDNTALRFAACGWNVIGPVDGHDVAAVDAAIAQAKTSADKPTLIICKTHIGKGSPTAPTPPRRTASRWAPRKSSSRAKRWAGPRALRDPRRRLRRLGRQGRRARRRGRLERSALPPTRRPTPSWPPS